MDSLPACLVHCLLLEWLSPEEVWTAVRASGVLRRHATMIASTIPGAVFRAAQDEVLTDACIRWFQQQQRLRLELWTTVETDCLDTIFHKRNGVLHRDGDLPAVISVSGKRMWYQNGKCYHEDFVGPGVDWRTFLAKFANMNAALGLAIPPLVFDMPSKIVIRVSFDD